jgi:orotate phosphoribosyltransferase
MIISTEGIVLRQRKIANNRRMIVLFTKQYGKISAGTSVNETMQALSKIENANVIGLLISVDRKEKLENGKSALQTVQDEYGIEAHSIVNINDIIAFLESEENRKAINAPEEILDRVYAYREKWGAV